MRFLLRIRLLLATLVIIALVSCDGGNSSTSSVNLSPNNVGIPENTTTPNPESDDSPNQSPTTNPDSSTTSDFRVNCNFVLPCKWISEDTQIEVTLVTVGRQSNSGLLIVAYNVSAYRDVIIRNSRDFANGFSNDGSEFTGYVVSLDGSSLAINNNYFDVTLSAGETTNGSTLFGQELMSSSTYLSKLQLSLVEPSGQLLLPAFDMVPTPFY